MKNTSSNSSVNSNSLRHFHISCNEIEGDLGNYTVEQLEGLQNRCQELINLVVGAKALKDRKVTNDNSGQVTAAQTNHKTNIIEIRSGSISVDIGSQSSVKNSESSGTLNPIIFSDEENTKNDDNQTSITETTIENLKNPLTTYLSVPSKTEDDEDYLETLMGAASGLNRNPGLLREYGLENLEGLTNTCRNLIRYAIIESYSIKVQKVQSKKKSLELNDIKVLLDQTLQEHNGINKRTGQQPLAEDSSGFFTSEFDDSKELTNQTQDDSRQYKNSTSVYTLSYVSDKDAKSEEYTEK